MRPSIATIAQDYWVPACAGTTAASRCSPLRVEHLAAGGDGLRGDQHERDHARLGTFVHPVMDGAALHQHVTGLQMHGLAVELHVDLARDDGRVIDRVGAVVARRDAVAEAHHPEHDAVVERGAYLPTTGVDVAVVVHRQTVAGPDHGGVGARPGRGHVVGNLIDDDARVAVAVVASDDAADGEAHRLLPLVLHLNPSTRGSAKSIAGAVLALGDLGRT